MRLKIAWPLSRGRRVELDRRTASPWRARAPASSPPTSCRVQRPWRRSSRRWRGAGGHGGRRQRPGSTQAMAAQTVQHFGRIDILVNNAAIYGG